MKFVTALEARLPDVRVRASFDDLYRRCPARRWVGISNAFSMRAHVPDFLLGAEDGTIEVDAKTYARLRPDTPVLRQLRKVIRSMPVTVPYTEQTANTLHALDEEPPDAYWRLYTDQHAVVYPGRALEGPVGLEGLPGNPRVEFHTQDLHDYALSTGLKFDQGEPYQALLLLCALNGLEPHLRMATSEDNAVPHRGTLAREGFRLLHELWLGPLGRALGNIQNLTEEPTTLTTLARPRYGKNTFRTIYYDPSQGLEVPCVAAVHNNSEVYVPYSAAASREQAESMIV